jgi:hypothetical protein
MAGSYSHAVTDTGQLRNIHFMGIAAENLGDAYETIEEMYGMIWLLAHGDPYLVEIARQSYELGISSYSPGRQDPNEKPVEE